MIHLIYARATSHELREMLEVYGDFIKLAVDVERNILAGGGKLHADCEAVLLENGSNNDNVWGAPWQSLNVFTKPRITRKDCGDYGQSVARCPTVRDWNSYRERFVLDVVPIRLGGVSANLARIQSASRHDEHFELVRNMLEDSEYLIEWTAPEADVEVAGELIEIQIQLARWHLTWQTIWHDIERRRAMAEQAGKWSERILDLSGLLNEETYDKYNIPKR